MVVLSGVVGLIVFVVVFYGFGRCDLFYWCFVGCDNIVVELI